MMGRAPSAVDLMGQSCSRLATAAVPRSPISRQGWIPTVQLGSTDATICRMFRRTSQAGRSWAGSIGDPMPRRASPPGVTRVRAANRRIRRGWLHASPTRSFTGTSPAAGRTCIGVCDRSQGSKRGGVPRVPNRRRGAGNKAVAASARWASWDNGRLLKREGVLKRCRPGVRAGHGELRCRVDRRGAVPVCCPDPLESWEVTNKRSMCEGAPQHKAAI
jgi:hypothetical protein